MVRLLVVGLVGAFFILPGNAALKTSPMEHK